MNRTFLDDAASLGVLVDQIPNPRDRELYRSLKFLRVELCFRERVFIVFRIVQGEPVVLGRVKVLDYAATDQEGASTRLFDMETEEELLVGHVPTRLFDHEVFVHIPPTQTLRWDAIYTNNGIERSLAFPLMIKVATKLDHSPEGRVHLETVKSFAERWPQTLDLNSL